MESIHYCLAHRLNLTVKGTAIEVTEIEHFKNLMQLKKIIFEKLQDVYKVKSLKILGSKKDRYWLSSDVASKIIWELFS